LHDFYESDSMRAMLELQARGTVAFDYGNNRIRRCHSLCRGTRRGGAGMELLKQNPFPIEFCHEGDPVTHSL
jgi:urocanate hydratase